MTRYVIEVNDGCPWGRDGGYPTLEEAKKDLKAIKKEDNEIMREGGYKGPLGMTYYIIKEEEAGTTIYTTEVWKETL